MRAVGTGACRVLPPPPEASLQRCQVTGWTAVRITSAVTPPLPDHQNSRIAIYSAGSRHHIKHVTSAISFHHYSHSSKQGREIKTQREVKSPARSHTAGWALQASKPLLFLTSGSCSLSLWTLFPNRASSGGTGLLLYLGSKLVTTALPRDTGGAVSGSASR